MNVTLCHLQILMHVSNMLTLCAEACVAVSSRSDEPRVPGTDWPGSYSFLTTDRIEKNKLAPHHVDDHPAQALPLLLREVVEGAAVVLLHELEADREVVILQHRLVIVHDRQVAACDGRMQRKMISGRRRLPLASHAWLLNRRSASPLLRGHAISRSIIHD